MPKSFPPPAGSAPPSQPTHLRQANARALLQLLQKYSPCSRADLVRHSGLSAPTVSAAIASLHKLGLVESVGEGAPNGGRPAGLLRFYATHGYVAAADIGGTRLRMMLADLNGAPIAQWSTLLAARQKSPQAICTLIAEGLKTMCRQSGTPARKVMHLTAGAPGITNVDKGIVLSAPNLDQWTDVPLRSLLEAETGIPCAIENDTNLAALGEHWRGAAQAIDNFVFIALGTGVGAGIFLHGRLHQGANWSAGEIGYFGLTGKKRTPIRMSDTGQLESTIGGSGIEQEYLRILHRRRPPTSSESAALKASHIFDLAGQGDRAARTVLHHTAGILANAIADIALLLNPELIVLGGGVGSHPELCRATEKLLHHHQLPLPLLRSSNLGTQAQLHGAISLSLSAVTDHFLIL